MRLTPSARKSFIRSTQVALAGLDEIVKYVEGWDDLPLEEEELDILVRAANILNKFELDLGEQHDNRSGHQSRRY